MGSWSKKMMTSDISKREEQSKVFDDVCARVRDVMGEFGKEDSFAGVGDYLVGGDYIGFPDVIVFIGKLDLLQPIVVDKLQKIIREYSGWQIIISVAVKGHYKDWPAMGVYVRPNEIIDALERQYFPKQFQSLQYEGARRDDAAFPFATLG
jgi:hypothetical protein